MKFQILFTCLKSSRFFFFRSMEFPWVHLVMINLFISLVYERIILLSLCPLSIHVDFLLGGQRVYQLLYAYIL